MGDLSSTIACLAVGLARDVPDAYAREKLTSGFISFASKMDFVDWWKISFPFSKSEPNLLWSSAQSEYDKHTNLRIRPIGISDPEYPEFLRLIADPPSVIYVKGDSSILKGLKAIAVVGSRDATDTGLVISHRISRFLSESGWTIVSGLALGIDAQAHEGAIIGTSKTIAVLAHGLERASPVKNSRLADKILANGGIWLSEHAVGVPPRKEYFVLRNRIQIGLSAASIIVEAALRSGSMAQAKYCVSENRSLFAVVPQEARNPLGLNCEGTLAMVAELGARPVRSKDDYPTVISAATATYRYLMNLRELHTSM